MNKILIQAGADINVHTEYSKKSSLLGVMSLNGCTDMVCDIIEYGGVDFE